MKYNVLTKSWALLLVLALFVTGCSKEEEPPGPGDLAGLTFDADAVLDMVPAGLKNSSDSYAQSCWDNIQSAVDMSSFIGQMEVPSNATKSNLKASGETWQWSWSYRGESYTFYWTFDESGGKRFWTMEIQYGGGPRYNYIDAWETLDGKEGEVVYNFAWVAAVDGEIVDESDYVFWNYHWKQNNQGAYSLDFTWDSDDPEYDIYNQYNVIINTDGSGFIDYYLLDEMFYQMEWDVVGNGSWIWYSDGAEFMSGTWLAG